MGVTMTDTEIDLPPLPDTATVTQVAGVVRHVLSLLSGAGILAGLTISDSNLMALCSVGVWISLVGWSWWEKHQTHKTMVALAAAVPQAVIVPVPVPVSNVTPLPTA